MQFKDPSHTFNRTRTINSIVRHINTTSSSPESQVIVIEGPWGCGKSHILEKVQDQLKLQDTVDLIKFDPWYYKSTDQLVDALFNEICTQYPDKNRTKELSAAVEKYKEVLSGVVSFTIELSLPIQTIIILLMGLIARAIKKEDPKSVYEAKENISKLLRKRPRRTIISIDDIDRLDEREICELLRLVRMVADFENITYVLCFHRTTVEHAIKKIFPLGDHYLQKIVDHYFVVPPIDIDELASLIQVNLHSLSLKYPKSKVALDNPDSFRYCVVSGLITTPRSWVRLLQNTEIALNTHEEHICIHDLYVMEVIKLFVPQLYAQIDHHKHLLTSTTPLGNHDSAFNEEGEYQRFLASFGEDSTIAKRLINYLFKATERYHLDEHDVHQPNTRGWVNDRRIANLTAIKRYFEQSSDLETLSAAECEEIFQRTLSYDDIEKTLGDLTISKLIIFIKNIEHYYVEISKELQLRYILKTCNFISGRFSLDDQERIFSRIAPTSLFLVMFEILDSKHFTNSQYIKESSSILNQLDNPGYRGLFIQYMISLKKGHSPIETEQLFNDWCLSSSNYILDKKNRIWRLSLDIKAIYTLLIAESDDNKPLLEKSLEDNEHFLALLGHYIEFSFSTSNGPTRKVNLVELNKLIPTKFIKRRLETIAASDDMESETLALASQSLERLKRVKDKLEKM